MAAQSRSTHDTAHVFSRRHSFVCCFGGTIFNVHTPDRVTCSQPHSLMKHAAALIVASFLASAQALLLGGAPAVRAVPARSAVVARMPWEPVEADADAEDEDAAPKEVKKGIDFSGLAQLVTMGAGAPMLVRGLRAPQTAAPSDPSAHP